MPARRGLFFDLVEEVFSRLKTTGKAFVDRSIELTAIRTQDGFQVHLAPDLTWQILWNLKAESGDPSPVTATVYESSRGAIMPWEVVQYFRSAISLYDQGLYAPCLALISIAAEATLRSILANKGYIFEHGASSKPLYDDSKALVDSDGTHYSIALQSPVPHLPSEFVSAFDAPIEITLRRQEKGKRTDLLIMCPPPLLDYLSTDSIQTPGAKNVTGLGIALEIARSQHFIESLDLSVEADDVLKAVRNSLVHFSPTALDTELTTYSGVDGQTPFQLRHFLTRPRLVHDFVAEIPRFANEQYRKLYGCT
jgi:hypothetical protein